MRASKNIFIVFYLCACLAGCAGRSTISQDAGGDRPDTVFDALTPVPSTINIPVEIKTAYIEKIVNDEFSGRTHSSDTTLLGGLTNIRISARKNGSVRISAQGGELVYSLPVMVTVRASTNISALGLSRTVQQEAEAGITFKLRSKISLKKDWRISAATKAVGYRWTTEPVFKAGALSIPIKPIANYLADKQMAAIGPIIDCALANSDIIKKSVITPLWEQLYIPRGFTVPNTRDSIWMRFDPAGIHLSGLTGRGSYISALIGISAVTEAVMGDAPEKRDPNPPPDFTEPPEDADSAFAINLYAEIPFAKATAVCKENFNGKIFKSGMHRVTVNDIEVAGANPDGLITMRLNLSGSLKGIINLTGRAAYDDRENILTLNSLNFDMATANKYQKARNWLLKGIIIKKMKPLIKFPLSEMLNPEALTKTLLTDYPIQKGIVLNGKIDSLTIRGVETTESALRAVILASGTARLTVNGK
jgi:hypothetical protein